MDRGTFLKRVGIGALGLGGLSKVAFAPPAPAAAEEASQALYLAPVAVSSVTMSPILASGGLCAPVTPYYRVSLCDLQGNVLGELLPSVDAKRGGIRYKRPPA